MNLNKYYLYLRKRSKLGILYRNYYLYPILSYYVKGKVLDVGCGVGDFIGFYKNAVGVDINPETVEYCVNKGLTAFLMHLDKLPFGESTFNTVILDNVLEHLENPTVLLREIRRVLTPDGTFIVGVPGECGFHYDKDHKVYYDQQRLIDIICNFEFMHKKTLKMPIDFPFANKLLRQYCIYGIFNKINLE